MFIILCILFYLLEKERRHNARKAKEDFDKWRYSSIAQKTDWELID